jgi:hypothetical protein
MRFKSTLRSEHFISYLLNKGLELEPPDSERIAGPLRNTVAHLIRILLQL